MRTFPQGRTAKVAAEAAGFKERTYEAAKKVIEKAAQEVIDEMDAEAAGD